MAESKLVIATRESPLALWQANEVKRRLESLHQGLVVSLLGITTKGDKILGTPLAKVGGKGLFVKELEQAMMDGRADIAVHSMKDVPMELPDGLVLPVICEREEPRDAFVSQSYSALAELPSGARVGTSSLRRQCQLRQSRPDLSVIDLRGNVNTRLAKLDAGEYDAIILAAAGLIRLGLRERIAQFLDIDQSLPAVGQGAIGVECRGDDHQTQTLIAPLSDVESTLRIVAERAMNARLQGGCQVPIAGYAQLKQQQLSLQGLVGHVNGEPILRCAESTLLPAGGGDEERLQVAAALGVKVADTLLSQGAADLLATMHAALD